MAAGLITLQHFDYFRYSYRISNDQYLLVIALLFLVAGIWIGWRYLKSGRSEAVDDSPRKMIINPEQDLLSRREQDVLVLLANGYSNREIAGQLDMTENTVKTHLKNIFRKLGVGNRTQATAEALLLKVLI